MPHFLETISDGFLGFLFALGLLFCAAGVLALIEVLLGQLGIVLLFILGVPLMAGFFIG